MPGPGPRGPRGPKPRVENPGKLMGRLLKYVGKNYSSCSIEVIQRGFLQRITLTT